MFDAKISVTFSAVNNAKILHKNIISG